MLATSPRSVASNEKERSRMLCDAIKSGPSRVPAGAMLRATSLSEKEIDRLLAAIVDTRAEPVTIAAPEWGPR